MNQLFKPKIPLKSIFMRDFFQKLIVSICLLLILATGCRKDEKLLDENGSFSSAATMPPAAVKEQKGLLKFDSYVAQSWYNLVLKLIRETPGHAPPIAARSFGYMGVTLS